MFWNQSTSIVSNPSGVCAHKCAVQRFAHLFLFTLITEWVWRRGRISHGSSSKGFSRVLKLFEDLTGTGVTKTVSDPVCTVGVRECSISVQTVQSLFHRVPSEWFMSTDHNNVLTLRLINLEKVITVCVSVWLIWDCSQMQPACRIPVLQRDLLFFRPCLCGHKRHLNYFLCFGCGET